MWLLCLVLCSISSITAFLQQPSTPVVDTEYGKVQGKQVTVKGFDTPVNVFLGVPFAKPPLGPLRFRPPQPPEPWHYVKDATMFPPGCPQKLKMEELFPDTFSFWNESRFPFKRKPYSEDCLYLNIFTSANLTKKSNLPVMVYIHGGGQVIDSSFSYSGLALSTLGNVVVVTIQYRLGIFGFFSTGDEHALGNWGCLDQVAALHWIQKNIVNFGGDPSSVTIFGEDSGGFSVSALVLSPLTKNLFHRAIMQSGVVLQKALFSYNVKPITETIAVIAGCKTTTSAVLVQCMRQKTEDEILKINVNMNLYQVDFRGDPIEKYVFLPTVVDGVFFPKSPKELLDEKQFGGISLMMGITNDEFGWLFPTVMGYPLSEDGLDQETATELLWDSYPLVEIPKNLTPVVTQEYLGVTDDPVKKKRLFLDMLGDLTSGIPAVILARHYRNSGAPTYLYEFQHRPSVWGNVKPATVQADHGDDLFFVFGSPFLRDGFSEEEKQLSSRMMKYWSNFAWNGNPNGEGLLKWPQYDQNEEYLQINITSKIGKKLKEKEVAFFTELLAKELEDHI
ncbi:liver carboxylesterase 1-like [Trichosurus vulpecula]|uniref:liver carboxylesterase 1-like n=1 Tax=Trichosurus vulpecula TaxID=9337 RepID=UPI00186AD5AC|nr:liver carboxylesterase 1-like [Trichosurus vulpecula]